MKKKLLKELGWIYWSKEADYKNVSFDEYINIKQYLKTVGHVVKNTKTERLAFAGFGYKEDRRFLKQSLYYKDNTGYHVVFTYLGKSKTDGINEHEGTKAIHAVQDKFVELTGVKMRKAFGYTEEEFKICIPKSFNYDNQVYMNQELSGISKIDGCSQYPSGLLGRLPDATTEKRVSGRVKPTKEWPVAFYIKSGHCAEYNVFDTHDWVYSYFNRNLFRLTADNNDKIIQKPMLDDSEEITVLMKYSDYQLTDTYEYFYNIKEKYDHKSEEYKKAKLVLNASIGYFHTTGYKTFKMAHIAALAICRANNTIVNKAYQIGLKNVVSICVDGLIYVGKNKFGSDIKKLGTYHQEQTNVDFKQIKHNCYMFIKDGIVLDYKHGAYDSTKIGDKVYKIDEMPPKKFDDMNNWFVGEKKRKILN